MFGSIGPAELIVVMALALLIFGPKKLPEIGKSIGNAMREFKKASSDFMEAVNSPSYDADDDKAAVNGADYPTAPALASAENYETLPYGSDFYGPDPGGYVESGQYDASDATPLEETESQPVGVPDVGDQLPQEALPEHQAVENTQEGKV